MTPAEFYRHLCLEYGFRVNQFTDKDLERFEEFESMCRENRWNWKVSLIGLFEACKRAAGGKRHRRKPFTTMLVSDWAKLVYAGANTDYTRRHGHEMDPVQVHSKKLSARSLIEGDYEKLTTYTRDGLSPEEAVLTALFVLSDLWFAVDDRVRDLSRFFGRDEAVKATREWLWSPDNRSVRMEAEDRVRQYYAGL